jgi:hypothetical protein
MTRQQNIINIISIFSTSIVLFSCATILNSPVQKICVSADRNAKVLSIDKAILADSALPCKDSSRKYYVKRSRDFLKVNLQIDSSKKSIFLKPKNSFAFWLNFSTYGIGMLIDINNPKRFAYSNNYHFTAGDTANKRYRFKPIKAKHKIASFKKGAINFSLSIPFTTLFNIKTIHGQYESEGIFGLDAGIDYYYKDNRYLAINLGAGTDVLPVDYFGSGYIYRSNTIFASAQDNFVLKSFNLGYGISLSRFNWAEYSLDTSKIGHSLSNIALGLRLSAQYRITKYFNLGILYQPNLLNTSFRPTFAYQHYISLNVIWKFPIKKTTK